MSENKDLAQYPLTPEEAIPQVLAEIAQGDPGDEQAEVPNTPIPPQVLTQTEPAIAENNITSNQGSNFKS